MTKYIIGEIFSSGGATLYKNPSDQTVYTKCLGDSILLDGSIRIFSSNDGQEYNNNCQAERIKKRNCKS